MKVRVLWVNGKNMGKKSTRGNIYRCLSHKIMTKYVAAVMKLATAIIYIAERYSFIN
jgi:hypothetical protein